MQKRPGSLENPKLELRATEQARVTHQACLKKYVRIGSLAKINPNASLFHAVLWLGFTTAALSMPTSRDSFQHQLY